MLAKPNGRRRGLRGIGPHRDLVREVYNGIRGILNPRRKQREGAFRSLRRSRRQAARAVTTRETLDALPKRRTADMAHTEIAIHEDDVHPSKVVHRSQEMDSRVQLVSDDEDEDEDEIYFAELTESEDEIDESVAEDMQKLEESFKGISQKYRLINRIGEGTFSTVYKAERLRHNDIPEDENDQPNEPDYTDAPAAKRRKTTEPSHLITLRKCRFVALKKIYVTSSPHRILNELELLHELRQSKFICPLLTAFRHLDQVIAVLPYFRHLDFRLYYRDFLINDMRHYFRSLFYALAHVHRAGILHRDIKPTNFLYDHAKRHGVLVDFGLAERQGTDWQPCMCQEHKDKRRDRFMNSYAVQVLQQQPDGISPGYPKTDQRPSRRANRAGTRGFRAPEVLLKCTAQTTKIDVWSAGVILLTLLARRFPFFNSADDVDAMIEIASIFGKKRMQAVAAMHGSVFETNIETIGEKGFTLEKIVLWASCREKESEGLRAGEEQAVKFLQGLLELDPTRRMSAKEALEDAFFTNPIEDEVEREEREEQEAAEKEEKERIRQELLQG